MSMETIEEDECLRTRSLILKPVEDGDAAVIAELANDRHIAEMTARIPHPYALADAERFLSNLGDERVFALRRSSDGRFVGCAGLKPLAREGGHELGYWLGRAFWGSGLATQAAQALTDHAFGTLEADLVEVRCRVVNGASRRVIQKCGFHYAGTSLDTSLVAGRVASETYRMDRRCWQSLKNWGSA